MSQANNNAALVIAENEADSHRKGTLQHLHACLVQGKGGGLGEEA